MTQFRVRKIVVVCGCLLVLAASAQAATVRFEAESTGAVKDQGDIAAYDSLNGVWGRFADAGASGGEFLYSTNSVARNIKVGFVGSGIDLIAGIRPNGDTFSWILDGGTPGQQNGVGTTVGAPADQVAIPIVSGLPNTLHTLEIIHNTGNPTTIYVDAFDVHDAGSQTRYEMENNAPIVYSPDANWTRPYPFDHAAEEASGGNIGYSLTTGDTATLNFTGTAVSLIVSARPDASRIQWSIDGSPFSNLNPALTNLLAFGFNHRWPLLLTNTLAPGNHTLTLKSFINIGAANFDAIDVYGVPEPGSIGLALIGFLVLGAARRRLR